MSTLCTHNAKYLIVKAGVMQVTTVVLRVAVHESG